MDRLPNRLLAAEVLDLPQVQFLEPAFSELPDDQYTIWLEEIPADQGRLLVDEESDPLALAFQTGNGWLAGSFHLRRPSAGAIAHFEEVGGDIFQEERGLWAEAVREYYSAEILESVTPGLDDLNPARIGMVESLLSEMWGEKGGFTCLDCCCGSGLGSHVLRRRGIHPLSCDNDPTLLSLGLSTGRLLPRETMCIDATRTAEYLPHVEAGLGLMFGQINAFNQEVWREITAALVEITTRSLITVETSPEADLIRGWAEEQGKTVDMRESPRDPIYDHWVCLIE